MAELTQNLRTFWNDLGRGSRAGVAAGVLVIVAAVGLFAYWTLKRDYQVLFKDMAQRDAAAVVAELKRLKVPYRLDGDGGSIRVPAESVHETRLSLMGSGVPLSGGVGFELFDKSDLSMTEYAQKINYQRALQGELARTIMSIEGVRHARVHLVLPESSVFRRDKARPKASVNVALASGSALSESQIQGIQRLVAAAAPGLEPSMVTVVDQRGVTVSAASDGAPGAAVGGQLRVKKDVEEYLTRKVAEVLDRSFGPGQAIVSIDVALNFDEVRRTTQDVVPAGGTAREQAGVLVHKREVVQRQSRPSTLKVVDADGSNGRREDGQYNSTLETNYEVSRRVEQVVSSPGSIRRVSVGVVLPRAVAKEVASQMESLVAVAAGLDVQRGDAIVVHALDQMVVAEPRAASAPAIAASPAPAAPADQPLHAWTLLGIAALIGLLIGLAIALALRKGQREARREAVLAEINRTLGEARP